MKQPPNQSNTAVPSVACFTVMEQLFCSNKRSYGITEIDVESFNVLLTYSMKNQLRLYVISGTR